MTYANSFVGDPNTPYFWMFPDTAGAMKKFDAFFLPAMRDFNAMVCQVATRHRATCIDILPAFNGSAGTDRIPEALRESQAQMDLIAKSIDDAGYAPLE